MSQEARCYVEISRSRIAANYRAVKAAVSPGMSVIGVVKANAYGHGAVEVARVLVLEGIDWLAVSSVEEGATLRQAGINYIATIPHRVHRGRFRSPPPVPDSSNPRT